MVFPWLVPGIGEPGHTAALDPFLVFFQPGAGTLPGVSVRLGRADLRPQPRAHVHRRRWAAPVFYTLRRQGEKRHYDSRPLARKNRVFTFNDQVLDNMFWTCASGVTVWSAYEALMMWALANGHAPMLLWPDHALWLALLIFLIPIWETLYFYLIHRLIHWPPLYRSVHYLHHRNTNVGPWSGLSMHPVEHVIYLGSVLVHWVIPANPLLIIYHLQHYTLSAATTHTGYEGLEVGGKLRLALGTYHHQLHHRFFECNYGGLEIPCDVWAGSFNDGTPESHQHFLQKRRLKAQGAGLSTDS